MRQGQRKNQLLGRAKMSQCGWWMARAGFLICATFLHASAEGQTMYWADTTPGGGNWLDPLNWRDYQPDAFYHFVVDNGGTAVISEGLVQGSYGAIGSTFDGSVLQTGGRLELTSDQFPVTIGQYTDSTGRFDLQGGTSLINTLHVGFQGTGEVRIGSGELRLDRELAVASYGTGTGTVVQSGGIVAPSSPQARPVIYVGRAPNNTIPGSYEFQRGLISITDMGVQYGTFQQSGGELLVDNFMSVGALPDRASTLILDPGAYFTQARHFEINGSTSPEMSQVIQAGGLVQSTNTIVKRGVYRLTEGLRLSDNLLMDAGGRWQSAGGVSLAEVVTLEGRFDPAFNESDARYEHVNGFLRSGRLVLKTGGGATFSQTGGSVAVDHLDIGVSGSEGNAATYLFSAGDLHVDSLLRIGTDSHRGVIDFRNRPTTLEMGPGSRLELGPLATIRNGANATLRMGPGSVLIAPPNLNLANLVGNFEHQNLVVHRPGQVLTINANQSAFVGGLDLSAGLVVHGHAYGKSDKAFNVTSNGSLLVGPTGLAELGPGSFFGITNSATSGVFGGTLEIEQLVIGPSGAGEFTVDSGLLRASAVIVGSGSTQPSTLNVRDGNLQANSITVRGSGSSFNQHGGQTHVTGQLQVTNRSQLSQTDGQRYIGHLVLDGQSTYTQSGGVTRMGRLSTDNTQLQLLGGDLIAQGGVRLRSSTDRFDFANSSASLQLEGALFVTNSTTPFLRSSSATFRADEHSLIVVPVGTTLANRFGTYDNRALMGNINQSLRIPAAREIHGQGDLSELGRITIEGGLLAAPGGGFEIYEFTMLEGSRVDLGTGTAFAVGGLGNTFVQGGTLRGGALVIDPSVGSEFVQTGGSVEFGVVDIRGPGKYKLHGGELTVHGTLKGSALDFGHSDSTLVLGPDGYLELDRTFVTGEENAHLIGQPGSLIVYDGLDAPNLTFAGFLTEGLLHPRGATLEIPAEKRLGISGRFDGDLINRGMVDPSYGLAELDIAGDFQQEASGRLRLQLGSTTNNDTLVVRGSAILDGALQVDFVNGFLPDVGDEVLLLYANGITGNFDTIIHPQLPDGLDLQVRVDDSRAFLVAKRVPPALSSEQQAGDFDGNQQLDSNDIDLLAVALRKADRLGTFANDPLFDLDNSGRLDFDDLRTLVEQKIQTRFGDTNLDGQVNNQDFDLWNTRPFTDQVGWRAGDFNGDGMADGSDFNLWLSNRGWSADALGAVPEPAGMALWFTGLMLIGLRYRHSL